MWLLLSLAFAGRGIEWVEGPRTGSGSLSARVRAPALDPGKAGTLKLVVDGVVAPTVVVPASQGGAVTILAFDGSGSFQRHHGRAFDAASMYVEHRLPKEKLGAVVFGQTSREWSPTEDLPAIEKLLGEARSLGAPQKETRLAGSIRHAVDLAAQALPLSEGGVRRVVVFTDAGEESEVLSVEEVAAHARERRVAVDAVVFVPKDAKSVARDLDRLTQLVTKSGGRVVEVPEGLAVPIESLPKDALALWELRAGWCGDAPPQVGVQGPDGLSASDTPAEGALFPCPAAAASPLVTAGSQPPQAAPLPGKASGMVCLFLSLMGFAGLGAFAFGVARRATRQEPVAPKEPMMLKPPPSPPPSEPPPPPKAARPQSTPLAVNLPETHLEVIGGDLPLGTRWRFAGRILRVGAIEEDNDVVVNLPQISSRHARFELSPQGIVFVQDLGSANGTWVGRRRLSPQERIPVPAGERVSLSSQLVLAIARPHSEPS